jgi:transcriptional regulator with XRE-family HTH domain
MASPSLERLITRAALTNEQIEDGRAATRRHVHGYQLRTLRKEAGLTQVELAEKLDVSQNRISRLERGVIDSVQLDTLQRYVEALGATLRVTVDCDQYTMTLLPVPSGVPFGDASEERTGSAGDGDTQAGSDVGGSLRA